MIPRILTLLMTLVAGVVLGAWATGADDIVPEPITRPVTQTSAPAAGVMAVDFADTDDDGTANVSEIIETIYATLDMEVRERQRLEEQVASLSDKVAELTARISGDREAAKALQARIRPQPRGALTEQTLVDAGFNVAEAGMIKRLLDQIELDQLFLRDTAMREGWMGSARYRDEMRVLNERRNGLRGELGEDGWDRYLYAQGRPNRVTVVSVLNDSPAYSAGIEDGDIIITYEDQRVFDQRDVRTVTATGQAGAMVAVEIERNGSRHQVYVPRGPLGVRLGNAVVKP